MPASTQDEARARIEDLQGRIDVLQSELDAEWERYWAVDRLAHGARLRELRQATGLDVAMAARVCGLLPETVRRAEEGVAMISALTLTRLSRLYGWAEVG